MSATAERTTTAEVLRRALALLPNTWVNTYPDEDAGEHCAITAINEVARGGKRAKQFLCEAIGEQADSRYVAALDVVIAEWNDAPERTWPEVKAAFEKAIELAEASR